MQGSRTPSMPINVRGHQRHPSTGSVDSVGSEPDFDIIAFASTSRYNTLYAMRVPRPVMLFNGYPMKMRGINKVHIEPNQFQRGKELHIKTGDKTRTCCRCSKIFKMNADGSMPVEECTYHYRGLTNGRTICCGERKYDSIGCMKSNTHVFDQMEEEELEKFISTPQVFGPDKRSKNVLAIDCEMAYTTKGLELVKVSLVNMDGDVELNLIVKPEGTLVCANTKFSGVTAAEIMSSRDTLKTVHQKMFKLINQQTILIGHSLENDLKVLRLEHPLVIDTSILFAEYGMKPSLRSLTARYLNKLIQTDAGANACHDSVEDALSCVELVHYLVRQTFPYRHRRY